MAYDGRVYRILIASPSDVEEEREIAVKTIQEWNDLHSYTRKVVLLPLRWETHTAPEYGARPQEVVNRYIVDQCDLLVGLFWTRVGTPTGAADSGTLEEISRVASAGKPVMLYFSKIGIDPDNVETEQLLKLREFKEKTYPNALVETYKSVFDFHDKFAKQLEIRLRELQKADNPAEQPIELSFISANRELIGSNYSTSVVLPQVAGDDQIDNKNREAIESEIESRVRKAVSVPVLLAIRNRSTSGLRNLFVEMTIQATQRNTDVVDPRQVSLFSRTVWLSEYQNETLSFSGDGGLKKVDDEWKLSFEWEALQPQRIRIVQPVLWVIPRESGSISFAAKVFADSFPQPLNFKANLAVEVTQNNVTLDEFFPDWRKVPEKKNSLLEALHGRPNV